MFGKIFVKEWKEKLSIFLFGTGLLALALIVCMGLPQDQNARELLAGGLLILFFPFMALLLGANGFEQESRNEAWTYLFSRPVGKGLIWVAKYVALLTVLASLWLVFLGAMLAVPGLRALVAGFRFPVDFGNEISFLPWSFLLSLLLFTIAFSLSLFSSKWLNVLFAALFIGLAAAFIAYGEATVATMLLRDEWRDGDKWLHAFRWGIIFMGLAFAGASVLTLTRADFSQPRKKVGRFIMYAAPLLFAAVVLAAAWTALLPRTGDRFIYLMDHAGGEAFFQTENGIFKYSVSRNGVSRLARGVAYYFGPSPIRGGRLVYQDIDFSITRHKPLLLWAINTDGSLKTRLVGGSFKRDDVRSRLSPGAFLLSPDGQQVVFLDEGSSDRSPKDASPLWAIKTDGTDLRNLPLPPALVQGLAKKSWLSLDLWPAATQSSFFIVERTTPQYASKLWLYDLQSRTARALLENIQGFWPGTPSPSEDYLAVSYRTAAENTWHLGLLALKTIDLRKTEIPGAPYASRVAWSPGGDKLAFFSRKGEAPGTGAFALVVFSIPDWRIVATKEMTDNGKNAPLYSVRWLEDGARMVLVDPAGHCLKIIGPDLSDEKTIPLPASVGIPYKPMAWGDQVLIEDMKTYSLWRLDLKTDSWKRIF